MSLNNPKMRLNWMIYKCKCRSLMLQGEKFQDLFNRQIYQVHKSKRVKQLKIKDDK